MQAKTEDTENKIAQLAKSITVSLKDSINNIKSVNEDIHVLSINSKIQAAKAGKIGAVFSVIADSIQKLVGRTQKITEDLQQSVETTITQLTDINGYLGTQVRGERLFQASINMIDIIDRNLYERSCDVRWWATGNSVVNALKNKNEQTAEKCSQRLKTILDSYTVYFDIIVCDLNGEIISNGKPDLYASKGKHVENTEFFKSALATANGEEFGFEGVHKSPLVENKNVLVYSCGVREDGNTDGELLGVLCVIFNWDGLGKVVVEKTAKMLKEETEHSITTKIIYSNGQSIASSNGNTSCISSNVMDIMKKNQPYGFILPENTGDILYGFAFSQGFETYKTGWIALVEEQH